MPGQGFNSNPMVDSSFIQFMKQFIAESEGSDPFATTIPNDPARTMTWTEYQKLRDLGRLKEVRIKESALTPTGNTLYGTGGLFGLCGPDDIIGLVMQDDPLVPWIGFEPDTAQEKFVKMWTYMDVSGTAAGSIGTTVYGDACDDPPTSEKGVCEVYQGDFGTLRACGEAVKVADLALRKCDKQPTYTVPLEGVGKVRIDNDLDLETIAAAQVVKHEVSRELITGDKNTTGQFDGLTNLVKSGWASINGDRCYGMDSVIQDWENDTLTGAVNGHGSIIGKVRDIWRRIKWRIQQTGMGLPSEGDVVLMMPSWMAWQFLDEWAWWTIRTGAQYNEVFRDNYAMREFREKHANGRFGGGYITIDGFNIHIMPHDWMAVDQTAPYFCSDIYLLVRGFGGRRVMQGQFVPADVGSSAVADVAGYRYFNVESMQSGRALRWTKFDNACVSPCLLIRPRLFMECPWAQGKIENVCVSTQFDPQTLDPQSDYFIEQNPVVSTHHTQYWYEEGSGWFH